MHDSATASASARGFTNLRALVAGILIVTVVSLGYFASVVTHTSGGDDDDALRACGPHYPPSPTRLVFSPLHLRESEESRHRQYMRVFEAYATFHTCMLRWQRSRGRSLADLPLLVVSLTNGIGNKVRGIASAFAAALLSRRVLLITWRGGVCDNCTWTSIFRPPPIPGLLLDRANEPWKVTWARWMDGIARWWSEQDTTARLPNFNPHAAVDPSPAARGGSVEFWDSYDFIVPRLIDAARQRYVGGDADWQRIVDLLDPQDCSAVRSAQLFFHHVTQWLVVPTEASLDAAADAIDDTFVKSGLVAKFGPAALQCAVGSHMRFHGEISGPAMDRWRAQHPTEKGFASEPWTQVANDWRRSLDRDYAADLVRAKKTNNNSGSADNRSVTSATPRATCGGPNGAMRIIATCDFCVDFVERNIARGHTSPVIWLAGNDTVEERMLHAGAMRGLHAILMLNAMPSLIGTTNSTMSWIAGYAGWRKLVLARTSLARQQPQVSEALTLGAADPSMLAVHRGSAECAAERIASCYSHERGY